MADPVGYVESHGGVQGFAQRTLTPSTAPLPPARLTPSPLTPLPGMYTPAPGTLTNSGALAGPSPTTLSAATGQVQTPRGKTGFVIAGVLVVAAAIIGVAVVLGGKKQEVAGPGPGSDVTQPAGSGSGMTTGSARTVEHGSAGSAVVMATGSGSAGSGSAAVATGSAGSAAGTTTGSAGSAAVVPAIATLTLTSTPDGADVYLNGAPTGKKTPVTIEVPRGGKMTVGFRLKGYEDQYLKEIALDRETITREATLKKSHSGGGTGKGSAHTPPGKGSAAKCDTCLERPE
ncbi:MAG: PEGA domain-containing protein, partial [Kofleriaceae bacterium]